MKSMTGFTRTPVGPGLDDRDRPTGLVAAARRRRRSTRGRRRTRSRRRTRRSRPGSPPGRRRGPARRRPDRPRRSSTDRGRCSSWRGCVLPRCVAPTERLLAHRETSSCGLLRTAYGTRRRPPIAIATIRCARRRGRGRPGAARPVEHLDVHRVASGRAARRGRRRRGATPVVRATSVIVRPSKASGPSVVSPRCSAAIVCIVDQRRAPRGPVPRTPVERTRSRAAGSPSFSQVALRT